MGSSIMVRFEDLHLFQRTALLGSFSSAAREANLLPGQVSAAIQRLERELKVRLFARSTRSLRLTAEGERYLPYAQQLLDIQQQSQQSLHSQADDLQGTLQLAAPSDFGRNLLLPRLSELCRQHPRLKLRLQLSDELTDVFRDPVDIAVRYGPIQDASYIALPLAPYNRRVLVAAPEYLAQHPVLETPKSLHQHSCLLYQLKGRAYDCWNFEHQSQKYSVQVEGHLLCDDADVVRRWAIAGEGIAYKSWLDVAEHVAQGALQVVLPEWRGESVPLYLICPHRQQFSSAVQALYRILQGQCQRLMKSIPA